MVSLLAGPRPLVPGRPALDDLTMSSAEPGPCFVGLDFLSSTMIHGVGGDADGREADSWS
jgi:hypothetical protein